MVSDLGDNERKKWEDLTGISIKKLKASSSLQTSLH